MIVTGASHPNGSKNFATLANTILFEILSLRLSFLKSKEKKSPSTDQCNPKRSKYEFEEPIFAQIESWKFNKAG